MTEKCCCFTAGESGFSIEEAGKRAGGAGMAKGFRQAGFVSFAPGLDGEAEGTGHAARIFCDGDGSINEHGIRAKLHGFRSVARCADPGINDDGDGGLFDDDAELIARGETLVRPDRRAQRHYGGRSGFLEALCEDGIRIDVGKHGETFFHKDFRGFQRLDRIGKQVSGVRMDFEFHPFWQTRGGGEPGEAHGFFRIHRTAGIRQEEEFYRIYEIQDVRVGITAAGKIRAAQGDGDDFRTAGGQRLAHGFIRREFSGAGEKPRADFAAGDDEGLHAIDSVVMSASQVANAAWSWMSYWKEGKPSARPAATFSGMSSM